jgi:type I restriction enzyme S subunit
MIADLKAYPSYKKLDFNWLGELPQHWQLVPVRRFSRVFAGATPSRGVPAYWNNGDIPWLASGDVNLRNIRTARQFITNEGFKNSSTKWIRPGSLVVALAGQGRTKGMVATVDFSATCNQSMAVIQPESEVIDHHYLAYWLESRYLDIRALVGDGLRDGLNLEHVKSIRSPVPPRDEQEAIVRYLNSVTGRLERTIKAKRKVITLLNEQKRAIISRAVTCGLDPSVSFKASSVVGVAGIPKHWEERRLRTLTAEAITNGVGESAQAFREDWPRYVRITDIGDTFSLRRSTRASLPPALAEKAVLRAGDLLIAAVGATFGKAYVHTELEEACFAGYLVRFRPNKTLDPRFAGYWTESTHYWTQLRTNVIQSTIQNFSAARVKRLLAIVPPIAEQASIVAFLEEETSAFNTAISRLEREIELLREYRTRLVADVVTGKMDVREAVANLPADSMSDSVELDTELVDEADVADEEIAI